MFFCLTWQVTYCIPPNLTCFIKAHPVPPEVTGSLSLIHLVLWLSRRTWPLDTAQQISKDKHSDALRAADSVSGRHLPVCFIVFTCWREPGLSYGEWTMVILRPLFRLLSMIKLVYSETFLIRIKWSKEEIWNHTNTIKKMVLLACIHYFTNTGKPQRHWQQWL